MNGKLDDTIPEPDQTVYPGGGPNSDFSPTARLANEQELAQEYRNHPGHLHPGDLIDGSYEILSWIGAGGMGNVYRVRQASLSKEFALKTLSLESFNESAWSRFQNEARAIARLNHQNIVTIYNLGIHNDTMPYYVMDLLSGETFAGLLKKHGPLDYRQALSLFIEVCSGLGFAHKHGIIHRDIKPENLLLLNNPPNPNCRVKIFDFGIAKLAGATGPESQKLTRAGDIFGSPLYMSPEQGSGHTVDARSDTYSLGCALFEVLTGKPPYYGATAVETIMMHQTAPIPSLKEACSVTDARQFPEMLESIIATLLAKSPKDRYQTTELLAADLQAVLNGREAPVRPHFSTPEIALPGLETSIRQKRRIEAAARNGDEYASSVGKRANLKMIMVTLTASIAIMTALVMGLGISKSDRNIGVNKASNGLRAASTKSPSSPYSQGQELGNKEQIEILNEYKSANKLFDKALPPDRITGPLSIKDHNQFSTRITKDGLAFKRFNFPEDIEIGKISGRDNIQIDARGEVLLRADEPVNFWVGEGLLLFPQYADRFRPGDVDSIFMTGKYIDARAIKLLGKFKGWSQLNLLKCPNLRANDLKYIKPDVDSEQLGFGECGFSADDLAKWPEISKFRNLICVSEKSTDNLLKSLSGPRNKPLQVHMLNSTISHRGFEYLSKQQNLLYLDLRQSQFAIKDLNLLEANERLNSLDLGDNSITQSTVDTLKKLKFLKNLWLTTPPSAAARAMIKEQLPGLRVKISIKLPIE